MSGSYRGKLKCTFQKLIIYPRGYGAELQNRKVGVRVIENNSVESNKIFYTAIDVMAILGVSKSTAYREMKKLNDELKKQGYITISGKVPVKYFMQRLYC